MSIIKRIKLKGFKSFANPTILNFEDGFNTIVGANGSGKSNVFDALCFVLGRMSSKGLRADKLGNLVFNGGKTTKPSKEAEVAIYLSNDERELLNVELDEIKISRIVKKSGSSNYYLNNNKCTRTEIVEILKRASIDPDGYNIILQGDIMRVVNMSPNERRELIEEIACISNYEEKRQQSLKKLDKVETNLKEADLLLEEKTKYIKELKSEKEQAEKFHQVKDDLRFNNLLLVKAKLIRNNILKEKKETDIKTQEVELTKHKDKLEEFETTEADINKKIEELEKSIEIKSHQDFISVTNKITSLEAEIQKQSEKKAEIQKQSEEIKTKSTNIKENIKQTKEKLKIIEQKNKDLEIKRKTIQKELGEVETEITKMKGNFSGDSFKDLEEVDELIDQLNDKKHNKNQIRQDNAIQVEKLNTKIEHLEIDLRKIESSSTENKAQFDDLDKKRKQLKKLIIEISSSISNNSETSAKLHNLNKEYSELVEEHSKLRMKVESSKDLMATNKAVDTILKLKHKDNSIHGTVAELATVPDKYSMALETVAGKNLFNLVVDNDNTAVKYINYLKENKIGNATFLPLNKVNTKFRLDDSVLNKRGVIDYALNLIKYDKQYDNIFNLVFQDTVVIEKIEDAKGVGIGDYKMITLAGDIVAKSGAMSGGFRSRNKALGAFKDDKSTEKLMELDAKVMGLKSTMDLLKEDKEDSERKIYDLRQEKADLEGDISKLEKLLSIEGKDTDSIKKDIESIVSDKTVIENSLKKISREIDEIDKELGIAQEKKNKFKTSSSESGQAFGKISEYEEKRDKLKEKQREIFSLIDSNNTQINSVLNPEIINLEKILKESDEAIINIKTQLDDLTQILKELNEELIIFKKKEKELSKDYKDFIEKRDLLKKIKENKKKIEEKYEKEYSKFDKVKERLAQLNYAISEYETLKNTLNDELELLYEQLKVEFIENNEEEQENKTGENKIDELINSVDDKLQNRNIDIKELQNKVNYLKTKLNSFGSINMKAVKIYDKIK
jgi:chromosome segregation protein